MSGMKLFLSGRFCIQLLGKEANRLESFSCKFRELLVFIFYNIFQVLVASKGGGPLETCRRGGLL